MKTISQLRWGERGQATVELALVMMILMIIVVGIFEFGRAWSEKQVITNAVRDGARIAALTKNNPSIALDSADNTIKRGLTTAGIPLPSDWSTACLWTNFKGATGSAVTVSLMVDYKFTFLGPLLQWTTGQSTIKLATKFTMRNE